MSDRLAGLLLWTLADVSIRWGLLILALAAWFAIRPPRRAATRSTLCVAALLAGPALLAAPRWDAYVFGVAPTPAPALAPKPPPAPVPDVSPWRPLPPDRVEAIEPRAEVEVRPAPTRPVAPVDWRSVAAKAAVGVWLAGSLLMLARLALGVRAMQRWARRGTAATAEDLALLDACRASPPTSRPVRLMRHPEVASPAMAGGLRPAIMLPPDWDAWPAERRRAALQHELAHVRRYDDASKLFEESLRVPMWFHPAVAWLLARLDRERELLCDEAAVAAGDDPKGLARLLLDLSRSPSPRRPPAASLPFLTRRTTAIRIRRLLEDDMPRTLSRPSLARTLLLGPAALAALLALGAARVREATAQDAPPPALAVEPAREAGAKHESRSDPAPSRPIEGVVVDTEGEPISGATVVVEGRAEFGRRTLTTDESGRFSTPGAPDNGSVSILAGKPGFAPASSFHPGARASMNPDPTKGPIKLSRAEPFVGVLVDERDQPMADATLRIVRTEWSIRLAADQRPAFEAHNAQFPRERTAGTPFDEALTVKTAQDGSFTFPSAVGARAAVRLEIVAADGRPRILRRPEWKGRGGTREEMGWVRVNAQERSRLVAIEGATIEGRIISRVPGVDPTSVEVNISALWSPGMPPPDELHPRQARPDAEGRFTFDGLELGTVRIDVHGPGVMKTWTYRPVLNLALNSGETAAPTIEIVPGVEVSGKIVSGRTGRPIAGTMLEIHDPDNTRNWSKRTGVRIDAEGRYTCRLLPGRTYTFTLAGVPPGGPPNRTSAKLDVPEGATTLAGPTFDLDGVETISGRLLDADGRPIAEAKVDLLAVSPPSETNRRTSTRTDDGGVFRLTIAHEHGEPGQPIALWIELKDGRKFKAQATPDAGGEYVVKFDERSPAAPPPPDAAPIEGTVLGPEGKPAAGATVVVAGEGDFGRRVLTTDAEGRFSTPGATGAGQVQILTVGPGSAPTATGRLDPTIRSTFQSPLVLKASPPAPFAASLVDEQARPLAGATVRVVQTASERDLDGDGTRMVATYMRFPREFTIGTPIDASLVATTAEDGSFSLPEAVPAGDGLRLEIVAADGRPRLIRRPPWDGRWSMRDQGFVVAAPGERPRLVAIEAARIEGRVVSRVPGVSPAGVKIRVSGGRPTRESPPPDMFLSGVATADAEGRFVLDGLEVGVANVVAFGDGEGTAWTSRPVYDLPLRPGRTASATIELIEGVEVSGSVVAEGTASPVGDVRLITSDASRPGDGGASVHFTTDPRGRYRHRLPSGEVMLYASIIPDAYARPEGRTVTIPEGTKELAVPPIELGLPWSLRGRVVDADGNPIADAKVEGLTVDTPSRNLGVEGRTTDERGAFRLQADPTRVGAGAPVMFRVTRRDGRVDQIVARPEADGNYTVKLAAEPVAPIRPEGDRPVGDAAPAKLKGTVADPDGKPIAGAVLNIRFEDPETFEPLRFWSVRSGEDGGFAWEGAKGVDRVALTVAAPGFVQADLRDVRVPTDAFKIAMRKPREFRGVLVDPEGRPIAGARVRVEQSIPHFADEPRDGEKLEGVVFGTSSRPVRLVAGSFTVSIFSPPAEVVTAEDGSFTFPACLDRPRMAVRLRATREGRPLAPASPPRQKVKVFNDLIVVDAGDRPEIVMAPAGRLEGRVVSKVVGFDPATLTATVRRRLGDVVSAPVDGEGRFALDGMDEGECRVEIHGPGEGRDWTWVRPTTPTLESGKTTTVAFEVVRGVEVRGRVVVLGTDEPAPGVGVAFTKDGDPNQTMAEATADAEGRYILRMPPGPATLWFRRAAERFAVPKPQPERRVEIPDAATFEAPDVVAERAVTIHGRVVDAQGAAVEGASLFVGFTTRVILGDHSGMSFARSGPDGTFRFPPGSSTVPPGEEVQLHVTIDGVANRVTAAPDAEGRVEVVLPAPSE